MQTVFISYAREDGKAFAKRLQAELERAGFQTWMDERNIDPYQDFSAEIETAIRAAHFVVVCVTKDVSFRENSFVRREIVYSQLWQQVTGDRPKLIPLVFPDGFPPPITIVHLTHIPCYTGKERTLDFEFGLRELRKRLGVEETLPLHTVGTRHASSASFVRREAIYEGLKTAPTPAPDPYRDHLGRLYDSIVDYLGQTVFSLITLSSTATPDAVAVLPMRFADANAGHIYGNIAEAFAANGESLLLLGDPGAGKTTTLLAFGREMVARRLENPDLRVPVALRIPEWSREMQPGLDAWVAEKTALPLDTVTELRRAGRLLLLLDGLDELGDSYEVSEKNLLGRERVKEKFDPRLRFMQMLERDLGSNAVMITCRIKDYEAIGAKIALKGAVTLRPLDDIQLVDYLRDQPDLLTAIRTDAGLREMAGTPLLLSLLRFAYAGMSEADRQQLRDLSHSPVELRENVFESYVEHRFEHERRRINMPLRYDLAVSYERLGQLAVYLLGSKHPVQKDILKKLASPNSTHAGQADQSNTGSDFLQQMRQLHLLVGDGDTTRFIHLLLRDYFALRWLLNARDWRVRDLQNEGLPAINRLQDRRLIPLVREWIALAEAETAADESTPYVGDILRELINLGDVETATTAAASILADKQHTWRKSLQKQMAIIRLIATIPAVGAGGLACMFLYPLQSLISLLQGGGFNAPLSPAILAVSFGIALIFWLIMLGPLVGKLNIGPYAAAVDALCRINTEEARQILERHKHNPDKRVRAAIKVVIERRAQTQ